MGGKASVRVNIAIWIIQVVIVHCDPLCNILHCMPHFHVSYCILVEIKSFLDKKYTKTKGIKDGNYVPKNCLWLGFKGIKTITYIILNPIYLFPISKSIAWNPYEPLHKKLQRHLNDGCAKFRSQVKVEIKILVTTNFWLNLFSPKESQKWCEKLVLKPKSNDKSTESFSALVQTVPEINISS